MSQAKSDRIDTRAEALGLGETDAAALIRVLPGYPSVSAAARAMGWPVHRPWSLARGNADLAAALAARGDATGPGRAPPPGVPTFREIGAAIGLSPERARQLVRAWTLRGAPEASARARVIRGERVA
jgi:hypothetical protein